MSSKLREVGKVLVAFWDMKFLCVQNQVAGLRRQQGLCILQVLVLSSMLLILSSDEKSTKTPQKNSFDHIDLPKRKSLLNISKSPMPPWWEDGSALLIFLETLLGLKTSRNGNEVFIKCTLKCVTVKWCQVSLANASK